MQNITERTTWETALVRSVWLVNVEQRTTKAGVATKALFILTVGVKNGSKVTEHTLTVSCERNLLSGRVAVFADHIGFGTGIARRVAMDCYTAKGW